MAMNNSLAEVHPELISEWSEKNLPLTPDDITFGSSIHPELVSEPFDDKMYSSKLREDFCWSRPKYYTVPISNPSKNNKHVPQNLKKSRFVA